MKYNELPFKTFYETLHGECLEKKDLLAVWLYMKTVYPEEEFNPVMLMGEFNVYPSLENWNSDRDYPYDSWEEIALDFTVIQFDDTIVVSDLCSGFKTGLFKF